MTARAVFFLIGLSTLLPAQQVDRFGHVAVCGLCHLRIPPPPGSSSNDVSIGPSAMWPGSMMAHAARDPYWKAKVRFETAKTPSLQSEIEDTCLRCHAPMQQYDRRLPGEKLALDDVDPIGAQGVGCTVCHQITDAGFGTKESFEAGFKINDRRFNYGPHSDPFSPPMWRHSGYVPVDGPHITEAALCATCHTVITPTVDQSGKVTGEFVEQAPYLEWLVSDYGEMGLTCQDCHLPVLEDRSGKPAAQFIAHNPGGRWFPPTSPRSPIGQHVLAGGNTAVLDMMGEIYPDEIDQLKAKREHSKNLLDEAISLSLDRQIDDGRLVVGVDVTNNTGHKLPTGFPSRRIWLHVVVRDGGGAPVFESGAWEEETGEILGLAGMQPHHSVITDSGQVMIYEAEMAGAEGQPTMTLLRAAGYAKDNRLLPSGFDLKKDLPSGIEAATIAPVGVSGDTAFEAGGHRVVYEIDVGDAKGPYSVNVEALYQSIKPAHALALREDKSTETATFLDLWRRHRAPVVMARVTLEQ